LDAVRKLRDELRAFHNTGLVALQEDLEKARESVATLPGRGSWGCCPLSYRLGSRGSADRDSGGYSSNVFTEAWDGIQQDYMDEMVVLNAVKDEMKRREAKKHREGFSAPIQFRQRKPNVARHIGIATG
jgi:hypothetical protein